MPRSLSGSQYDCAEYASDYLAGPVESQLVVKSRNNSLLLMREDTISSSVYDPFPAPIYKSEQSGYRRDTPLEEQKVMETEKRVLAACMDLCGSTERGLGLPEYLNDQFNFHTVEHLRQNIDGIGLVNTITKCTGDGWLVMTDDPANVFALCALSMIVGRFFQEDLSERTGIPKGHIPQVRVGIGAGRDIAVKMPDGRPDWMGDSARRVARMHQICKPGEILVCEEIRSSALRSFEFQRLDFGERLEELGLIPDDLQWEEDFSIWVLKDLSQTYYTSDFEVQQISDVESQQWLVYLLERLGRATRAEEVATYSANQLVTGAGSKLRTPGKVRDLLADLVRATGSYAVARELVSLVPSEELGVDLLNRLVAKGPTGPDAVRCLQEFKRHDVVPDVVTYSTLISQAKTFDDAKEWFAQMVAEGIKPNVVTYSTLISQAKTFDDAKEWFAQMVAEGIKPNVVTYNTLISQAKTFDDAKEWFAQMVAEGIKPDVVTYSTLFSKNLSRLSAKALLHWYHEQPYHPDQPLQAAISQYAKGGSINHAFRVALNYPHLQASRVFLRKLGPKAIARCEALLKRNSNDPNATYTLGVCYMLENRPDKAKAWIAKAATLSRPGKRKDALEAWLGGKREFPWS